MLTGGQDTGTTGSDTTASPTGSGTDTGADSGSGDSGDSDSGDSGDSGSGDESSSSTGGVFVCDPIDLGSATGEVAVGSTEGESDDIDATCAQYDSVEIEFAWTAPNTASYQIDTFGSTYDTALLILDEDCYGEQLACNDDFSELQSAVLVDLAAGQTIMVAVDGFGGAKGDYVLNIVEAVPGSCCEAGFFGGCDDNTCEADVCALDPTCCTDVWDSTCANVYAPVFCSQCAEPDSCCFAQDDGGCSDATCEAEICALDSTCCDTQWTQACADLAETNCQVCNPLDCCGAHPQPGCSTPSCQQIVCEEWDQWCCDQEWDEWCVQLAMDNCPVCQDPGPCCFANAQAGCEDPDISQCVCDTMPECCSVGWSAECVAAVSDLACGVCDPPDIGCVDVDLGSATGEVFAGTNIGAGDEYSPTCAGLGGEDIVFSWVAPSTTQWTFDTAGSDFDTALTVRFPDCDGDELACTAFFGDTFSTTVLDLVEGQHVLVTVDGNNGESGNYVLNINPPPGFGFCCAANFSPGCGNAACEAAVCDTMPECCEEEWTDLCAAEALIECAVCSDLGDCCEPQMSPGCQPLDCAATVCEFAPYCCDEVWDFECPELAFKFCPGVCM